MKTTVAFLLPLLLFGCDKQATPVSNFKVEEIAYARAAIFESETVWVLDSMGNYSSGVLDSIELSVNDAHAAVKTLLAGSNYTFPDYSSVPDGEPVSYGVMCHTPHFLLLAYDAEGHQTNRFTVCFDCGNVRMTNYRKYPKSDEFWPST